MVKGEYTHVSVDNDEAKRPPPYTRLRYIGRCASLPMSELRDIFRGRLAYLSIAETISGGADEKEMNDTGTPVPAGFTSAERHIMFEFDGRNLCSPNDRRTSRGNF